MSNRLLACALWLTLTLLALAGRHVDRRIVDTVFAGSPTSEAAHGFAAQDAETGLADGAPYRQARGWMHYALKAFEDTEVTVALTLVGGDSVSRGYDVVVEDSVIATRNFVAAAGAASVVEVLVPFALTKGKANIAIVVKGRGGVTPRLRAVRTIQDHYELDLSQPAISVLDRSLHTLGVSR